MALSSFSLVPFLSTGFLFFAWLGYGFLRFPFKLIEVFATLMVFGVFFSLLSGLGVFLSLALLSLPLAIPLLIFKPLSKFDPPLKTFLGGLGYLILIFLGTSLLGFGSFVLMFYSILTLSVLVLMEFLAAKIIKRG